MDIAQESIAIFRAVRSAERRSAELIAELDRQEAKVDASARQALIDERAYLLFFKHYAQQMLTWETMLAAPPVGIPTWSNQKRQQFFDALEVMQQQAAASRGQIEGMRAKIKLAEGSIQAIEEIPVAIRDVYRTVWEVPMRSLIDMAADRGAYIDQSQSLNLFSESPTIGKLSSMYAYAWEKGLKTTYYLRSRSATKIQKTTVTDSAEYTESEAVACSLENPGACEACQ